MPTDSDISWPVLRRIVQEWAGSSAELAEVKPLDGGCISTTLALNLTNHDKAVLKISAHRVDRSYQREAHQLELLRKAGVPAPAVYVWKIGTLDDPFSYLLMEFIEGVDWAEARRVATAEQFEGLQVHLAEVVRALHATTRGSYGRVEAEVVAGRDGERREAGCEEFEEWPKFYHHIYDQICQNMEKSPLVPVKGRKLIHKVRDKLDRLIAHEDCPRLLHWDLWASNILAACDDQGRYRVAALLDPHAKFGHAEAELAYLELFQTVGPAFMKAYQREGKLSEEYHRVRKPVYQLHSLLNHTHLFGEKYAKRLGAALERVGGLV